MHPSFRAGFEKVADWKGTVVTHATPAALGALGGAGIGAASADEGHRGKGALRGALIGGLSGGAYTGANYAIPKALDRLNPEGAIVKHFNRYPNFYGEALGASPTGATALTGIGAAAATS